MQTPFTHWRNIIAGKKDGFLSIAFLRILQTIVLLFNYCFNLNYFWLYVCFVTNFVCDWWLNLNAALALSKISECGTVTDDIFFSASNYDLWHSTICTDEEIGASDSCVAVGLIIKCIHDRNI